MSNLLTMKIEEAIDQMSSMYLERIIRSFTLEYPKKDEEFYREEIRKHIQTLSDKDELRKRYRRCYQDNQNPYSEKVLMSVIVLSLLDSEDNTATEDHVIEDVQSFEKWIISESGNSDSLKHKDKIKVEIFKAVLEVALEDQTISKDEMVLLRKLRAKLGLNERDQYLIQAQLGLFPTVDNKVHSASEIRRELSELQKAGLLFFCNQPASDKNQCYVIPEELVPGLKEVIDIELTDAKYKLLLEQLKNVQLSEILSSTNVNQYGTKEELIQRTIRVGLKPSEALSILSLVDLQNLCGRLEGIKKTGTKEEKIKDLINYFDQLITRKVDKVSDPREVLYSYFEELATRDLKNLLTLKIISHEREIDLKFERATRYIFEIIFNHELVKEGGTEHADGCVIINSKGDYLLWDNKSKLQGTDYDFPEREFKQFKRYIRDASNRGNRISCFLVVVPKVAEIAERNTHRLKSESGSDTDVAIVTAEDLKMVSEIWKKEGKGEKLNLEVFNTTGILTREVLKKRLKWYLK